MLRVCFRNSIERDRCAGLEHLCALSGGFLLVDFDVLGMRGLRCGEFLGRSGRIELFGLLLGLLRCGYDVYCVFIVHCRQVPKCSRCDFLCELSGGPVRDGVSREHKCLLGLLCRPISDGDGCDGLRRLPCRPVWNNMGCKYQCVFGLRRWPIPNGDGCDGLRELLSGPVRNRSGIEHEYLFGMRFRSISNAHGRFGLCKLRIRPIWN